MRRAPRAQQHPRLIRSPIEPMERRLLFANYFVALGGSDANSGASLLQPFRTIQHAALLAHGGDTIIIRGGTYRETVTPAFSGSAGNPITFIPYNNEPVTISGADVISGWSSAGGNLYQAPMSFTLGQEDQVFVDGQMMNLARWPNTSLDVSHPVKAIVDSGSYVDNGNGTSTGTINDSDLTQPAGYWIGATVHVVIGPAWVSQTGTVIGSNPGSIQFTFARVSGYSPSAGNPYYLFGKSEALDNPGEWFRDSATAALNLWTPGGDNPSTHLVEAKHRKNAFDLSGRSYITIQNLKLFASTINTNSSSSNNLIDGIDAKYVSHFSSTGGNLSWTVGANDSGIILNGTNNTLQNSHIAYSAGNGVAVFGTGNKVLNNLISDTDYMATDAAGINTGQAGDSTNTEIAYNTVHTSGRSLILLRKVKSGNIHHNDIYDAGIQTTDLGAIYTWQHDGQNTTIAYNKVHDSFSGGNPAVGIYLDNGSPNYIVHHNLVYNVGNALTLNLPSLNNQVYNNTLIGSVYSLAASGDSGSQTMAGTKIRNNIFTAATNILGDATASNNITSSTNPLFADSAGLNYALAGLSPAIDFGIGVAGITDGFLGAGPDAGAIEFGQSAWSAGSSLASTVPPSPDHLTAVSVGGRRLDLSWQDHATGESAYIVERATDGRTFTQIARLPANSTSYSDIGISGTYSYRVRADDSPFSNIATGVTGRDAYIKTEAESADGSSGVTFFSGGVGSFDTNDWLRYSQMSFGPGANQVTIRIATSQSNRSVELRLDSTSGTLIGTLSVANTGSFGTYTLQTTAISGASGTHDLYLIAKGGSGAGNLDYFQFGSVIYVPPIAPSGAAVSLSGGSIAVSWLDNSSDEDGFIIERSTDAVSFTRIGTASANAASFVDSSAPPGVGCYYRVSAYSVTGGFSAASSAGAIATSGISISGAAFTDADSNGVFDSSDEPRPNVFVFLDLDDDGIAGALEPQVLSDSAGNFSFATVRPGRYCIRAADALSIATEPSNAAWITTAGEAISTVSIGRFPTTFAGSAGDDTFTLSAVSGSTIRIIHTQTSGVHTYTIDKTRLSALSFNPDAGGNTFNIDYSTGNPLPDGPINFTGDGDDHLAFIGTAGADAVVIGSSSVNFLGTIAMSGVAGISFDGLGGGDDLSINNGNVTFPANQELQSLTIAAGATAALATGGKIIDASDISIGGTLDLTDGDLIARNSDEPSLASQIHDGAIFSSLAELSANRTALGVARAGDVFDFSSSTTALFDGRTVDANAVLVKYTYAGDGDLNGVINLDDYTRLDAEYDAEHAPVPTFQVCWLTGDFDRNGKINIDDFSLIDTNRLNQRELL